MAKIRTNRKIIGSPGLVVTGGDSCTNGGELKSQHGLLDGYFFTLMQGY